MLERSKAIGARSHSTHKAKQAARSKVIVSIAAILVLVLASSAYAASVGWLTFGGTITRTPNLDVRFANASFVGTPRAGESVTISASDDYKKLNISTALIMPGDSRVVQFQIQNMGNQAVRVLNVVASQDDRSSTGLHIEWPDDITTSPNLTNYVILPNATSSTFTMRISWDSSATNVLSGEIRSFSLTVNYQDASLPLSSVWGIKTHIRGYPA